MKKIISAVVCAALAVGMCGCGDKKSANADFKPGMDKNASASVEIIGKMDNFEALEAVIRDFNAVYPNVSVSYAKMDAYADNLPNLILGDNPPEIFMSYKSSFEQDSGLSDAVLDMNEIGLEKNVVDEGIMKACEYDGKSVRVPIMLNYQGIVANKTLLADAGLQIPKTYDEFTAACDALLAKGFTPIQGYSKTMYSSLLFNEWRCRLAKSENAAEIFDKINAGEDGCGDYFLDSFKILEDYRKKGYFSEDVNSAITDSYDAAILYFFEGKTPFLVCSSETVSGMKKRESKSDAFSAKPFEYEFCELPVTSRGSEAAVDIWSGFSIAKNSDNVEWAKEFMRFLFTADELNNMAVVKGMPTVAAVGNDDSRFNSLKELSKEQLVLNGDITATSFACDAYSDLALSVGKGDCTAEEAAQSFASVVKEKQTADE